MITINEARIQQKKAQKKSLLTLCICFLVLAAICVGLYFVGKQEFTFALYLSVFVLIYVAYKVKITEFFRVKEYKGEVTYFNVRTEQVKETNSHQAGTNYDTYTVFMADIIVKDQKGKARHKTFRYTKDYDNVKPGDKATILRFVDKPVIEICKETADNYKKYLTTDWKFNFSSLPYWNNREKIPYVFDKFYPIPQSDALCCIYSIAEAGMLKYLGFLAILKNKERPEMILNVSENMNFCDNFSVDKKGNIIFLQPFIYDKVLEKIQTPILIIDIGRKKFSYYKTDNHNPLYKVVELSENVFGIEADETQKNDERLMELTKEKIDLRNLEWFDLSEIKNLPTKLNN